MTRSCPNVVSQCVTHVCVVMLCKHTYCAASPLKAQQSDYVQYTPLLLMINDYITGLCTYILYFRVHLFYLLKKCMLQKRASLDCT